MKSRSPDRSGRRKEKRTQPDVGDRWAKRRPTCDDEMRSDPSTIEVLLGGRGADEAGGWTDGQAGGDGLASGRVGEREDERRAGGRESEIAV